MKKILVIDADNDTLKIFSSELKEHADKFELLTAGNIDEAQVFLANLSVDMIAVDLKIDQTNTLERLSTLVKEFSKIPFFIFAEAGNPEIKIKLKVLGIQNYFEKPLEAKKIAQKVTEDIFSNVGGQVHGISLPSFLQMSEMEKSSCTLKITSKGEIGYLFLLNGELFAAKTKDKSKEEAAYEILSWEDSAIEIEKATKKKKKEIRMPLMNLLMEGLRIKDEKAAQKPLETDQQAAPEIKISNVQDLISQKKEQKATPPAPQSVDTTSSPPPEQPAKKPQIKGKKKDKNLEQEAKLSDYHKEIIENAKEQKRKRTIMLLTAGTILIVLAASVTIVWLKIILPNQIKSEYENLITRISSQSSYEEMEKMVLNYINTNKAGIYTKNAKEKLAEIRSLMEERDYDQTLAKVKTLSVDDQFEKNSAAIFNEFLKKYPQSKFKEEIQNKILALPTFKDEHDFKVLKKIYKEKYIARAEAYNAYLSNHPKGKYKKDVTALMKDIGNEYYIYLKNEVEKCKENKDLDRCLKINVNGFVGRLDNNYWSGKIKALIKRVNDKKDYSLLLTRSEEIDHDLKAQRKIFTDYLKKNPTTTEKKHIRGEIKKIDKKLAKIEEWKQLVSYIMNPKKDVFSRVSKLDSYIANNPNSAYIEEAKKAKTMLNKEKRDVLWRQRIEKERREKALAEKQAAKRERERIAFETRKMAELIKKTNKRYKYNNDGTVIDTKTRLMWCLLDSQTKSQKCVDFESAIQYVDELNTGGYTDWRLPTANELVIIYKNKPFFPSTRTLWYWSSDVLVQGWNKKVNIVTSKQEIGWKKALYGPDNCGTIRAVRP